MTTITSQAPALREYMSQMRGPSLMIWLCAITVWLFIIWATFAWIPEIVRAEGEVISSSRPQIIQNLEGVFLPNFVSPKVMSSTKVIFWRAFMTQNFKQA